MPENLTSIWNSDTASQIGFGKASHFLSKAREPISTHFLCQISCKFLFSWGPPNILIIPYLPGKNCFYCLWKWDSANQALSQSWDKLMTFPYTKWPNISQNSLWIGDQSTRFTHKVNTYFLLVALSCLIKRESFSNVALQMHCCLYNLSNHIMVNRMTGLTQWMKMTILLSTCKKDQKSCLFLNSE